MQEHYFHEIFKKIEKSFLSATKGEEELRKLILWWGVLGYLIGFFVLRKIILAIDIRFIDIIISFFVVVYFCWHSYALIKCSPKKPKLTKEEKKKIREEKIKNAPKAFLRKLLLQESITKWNPATMTIVMNLIFITHFLGYILH